jgi:hypothetical protein
VAGRRRQVGRVGGAFSIGILAAIVVAVLFYRGGSFRSQVEQGLAVASAEIHRFTAKLPGRAPPPRVKVYECWREGVRVLSNSSCGPDAKLREVDVGQLNTYPAPAPVPAPAPAPAAQGQQAGLLAPAREKAEQYENAAKEHTRENEAN